MKTKRLLELIVIQLNNQRHLTEDQLEQDIIEELKREIEQRELQLEMVQ